MNLNERKIRILEAIITDYIKTGDPVGSRTISKKYPLGISSATIRNEMSDLEEMGLIHQPHTSAGRVPSDKGYRLYVDRLMHKSRLPENESIFLRELIANNISRIDYLMEQTAKALARLTNYAAVVTEADGEDDRLKRISLVPVDSRSLVMVSVTENKKVDNTIIRAENIPDIDELNRISSAINEYIGFYGSELNEYAAGVVAAEFGGSAELVEKVFSAIFKGGRKNSGIYYSGVDHILDYPGFSDVSKAKEVFSVLEQKDVLHRLLKNNSGNENEVQIIIGGENNISQLREISIIKTSCNLGDGNAGIIGVIGPTRMNYSQAVSVISETVSSLNEVIKALIGG